LPTLRNAIPTAVVSQVRQGKRAPLELIVVAAVEHPTGRIATSTVMN
jgi:hypothetical protein